MPRSRRLLLLASTCIVLLSGRSTFGSPQRNQANRRSIAEDTAPKDDDILSAPFAPGSSRDNVFSGNEKPRSASEWQDQTAAADGNENNMAAPNFHSSKTAWNRISFRNSAVLRSTNSRMGPHHQKLSASNEAIKKHKRRSFFNSKEGLVSPSKLAATIDSVSKNLIATISSEKSKSDEEKIETLPTPLPAAGARPIRNSSLSPPNVVKAVTVRKRSERKTDKRENRSLIKELGAILKDDEKESAKRLSPGVKRRAIAEDKVEDKDGTSDSSPKNNGIVGFGSKGGSKSDRKAFDDWLKNEYFRNMALSMSTAKRKRSSPRSVDETSDTRTKRKVDFDFDEAQFDADVNDEEFEERRSSHRTVENNVQTVLPADFDPETVQRRLQLLENAVLAEAVEKIVERARESAMTEAARDQVAQRLAEAFYLEKLQQAIDEKFPKSNGSPFRIKKPTNSRDFKEINDEEDPIDDNEDSWADVDPYQETFDENPIKRGNGNLAEALSGMADTKRRLEHGDCPELKFITSDCSSLEDILPPGTTVSPDLKHTCNKHEVCYTCGEAFGLTASICDVQFLRETARICGMEGDKCEPHDLTKILAPLRERRVFYKRGINPLCYRAHLCISRFLTEP